MLPKNKDHLKNSIFVEKDTKREINYIINSLFYEVSKLFCDKCHANLYYSGSIARKEPSLDIKSKILKSDIDLVAVYNNESDYFGRYSEEFINLIKNNKYGFDVTLFSVTKQNYLNFDSCFGYDLYRTYRYPLVENIEIHEIPKLILKKRHIFETFIHHTLNYHVHDYIDYQKEVKYSRDRKVVHFLKMLIEGMRLFVEDPHKDAPDYHSIFRLYINTSIVDIIRQEDVIQIFRNRECCVYENMPNIELDVFIIRALGAMFCSEDIDTIFEKIITYQKKNTVSFSITYQLLLLLLCISKYCSSHIKSKCVAVFKILCETYKMHVNNISDCFYNTGRYFLNDLGDECSFDKQIYIFLKYRDVYYRAISKIFL